MTNDLMSVFDIFNNKHNFIGFTDFFDDLYNFDKKFKNNSFPPYNIFTKEVNVCNNNDKEADCHKEVHTFIQMACAGYDKDRLKVQFNDKTCVLTVSANGGDEDKVANLDPIQEDKLNNSESIFSSGNGTIWYHKGIATRMFKNSWKLNDKLEFVKCNFENGLLTLEFRNKDMSKEDTNHILPIE